MGLQVGLDSEKGLLATFIVLFINYHLDLVWFEERKLILFSFYIKG